MGPRGTAGETRCEAGDDSLPSRPGECQVRTERVCVLLRMTAEERDRFRSAAQAEHRSLNGFLVHAACRAAGAVRNDPPAGNGEAEAAIACLVTAGMGKAEAQRKVQAAVSNQPEAGADALVLAAYREYGQ